MVALFDRVRVRVSAFATSSEILAADQTAIYILLS